MFFGYFPHWEYNAWYKNGFTFCIESVREFHKYSGKVRNDERYPGSAAFYEDQMRLFRGQRNFYISGFALFSLFIIKRLVTLLSQQAMLQADAEASRKQAENISKHVETLTSAASSSSKKASPKKEASPENENLLLDMKEKIAELGQQNEKLEKQLHALKKQAEATNKEYDRLTGEYSELQVHTDDPSTWIAFIHVLFFSIPQNKYDRISQTRDR